MWIQLCCLALYVGVLVIILTVRVASGDGYSTNWIMNEAIYDNVKDQIKAGDLLLFAEMRIAYFARVGHPIFTHLGMIIMIGGKPHVFEMVGPGYRLGKHRRGDNIIIMPLDERIKQYRGNVYIASLRKRLTTEQSTQLHAFATMAIDTYTFPSVVRGFFAEFFRTKLKTQRTCCDLVADAYSHIGVIDRSIYTQPLIKIFRSLTNHCGTDDHHTFHQPVLLLHNIVKDLTIPCHSY